jgi:XXXCH domain-containing protein
MSREAKIEKYVKPEEVPVFLRSLADAIENVAEGENAYLSVIEGFQRLKMSIKNEFGQTSIRVKAKPPKLKEQPDELPAETDEDSVLEGKPAYKKLKKRMKSAFKLIFKTIHEGNLPPDEAVKQFIEDSRLMVTYEGYGDEYYEEYSNAVDNFEKIYQSEDLEKMHEACDALNNIKAHCHAKYD